MLTFQESSAFSTSGTKERATSSKAARGVKELKYRSSCDLCQEGKIKCGQEKPRCQRCVARRQECVYSPSRRMGRRRNSPNVKSHDTNNHEAFARKASVNAPKDKELGPGISQSSMSTEYATPPTLSQHVDMMHMDFDTSDLNDFFYTYPSVGNSSCQSPSSAGGNNSTEDPWRQLDIDFTDASLAIHGLQTQQELDQPMTDDGFGSGHHVSSNSETTNSYSANPDPSNTSPTTSIAVKEDTHSTHSRHNSSSAHQKPSFTRDDFQLLSFAITPEFAPAPSTSSLNTKWSASDSAQECTCYNSVLRNLASSSKSQDKWASGSLAADLVLKVEHETQSILTELMSCRSCSQDGSALLLSFINVSKTLDLLEATAALEMKPQRRPSSNQSNANTSISSHQYRTSKSGSSSSLDGTAKSKRCTLQVGNFEVMDGGRSRFLRKIFQARLKALQVRLRSLHVGLGTTPQDCITRAGLVMVTGILRRLQTFTGRLELWDEQS